MNSKKAKRIRQLVRHLQSKALIEDSPWEVAGSIDHRRYASPSSILSSDPAVIRDEEAKLTSIYDVRKQRVLDPACGKAIYKTMKARAALNGRG